MASNSKTFKCPECGSEVLRGNKARHLQLHTGMKRFKCKYCSKEFTQRANCNIHECTHTGEKPYECKYCLKPFANYWVLRRHRREKKCSSKYEEIKDGREHTKASPSAVEHFTRPAAVGGRIETNRPSHEPDTLRLEVDGRNFLVKQWKSDPLRWTLIPNEDN